MKRTLILITILTFICFVSVCMAAQKTEKAKEPTKKEEPVKVEVKTFSGDIKTIEAKSITVVKDKESKIFVTDSKTKIRKGGKDVAASDLKVGMGVVVKYDATNLASEIVISDKEKPKEKKAAEKTPAKPDQKPKK